MNNTDVVVYLLRLKQEFSDTEFSQIIASPSWALVAESEMFAGDTSERQSFTRIRTREIRLILTREVNLATPSSAPSAEEIR